MSIVRIATYALVISTFFLGTGNASAISPSCPAEKAFRNSSEILDAYSKSVFVMQTATTVKLPNSDSEYEEEVKLSDSWKKNGFPAWKNMGSAILIDPRGYFITVSHNTGRGAKEAKGRRWPAKLSVDGKEVSVLSVAKPEYETVRKRGSKEVAYAFNAQEIAFGEPYKTCKARDIENEDNFDCTRNIDFSIIYAPEIARSAAYEGFDGTELAIPDLMLGHPFADRNFRNVVVIGYDGDRFNAGVRLLEHRLDTSGESFDASALTLQPAIYDDPSYLYYSSGITFAGFSGAPLIDARGRIWGLVSGSCEKEGLCPTLTRSITKENTTRFTRIDAAKYFLSKIPANPDGKDGRFLNLLSDPNAPNAEYSKVLALDGEFSALESYRVARTVFDALKFPPPHPYKREQMPPPSEWQLGGNNFPYKDGLQDPDLALGLLNILTCNYLFDESNLMLAVIHEANRDDPKLQFTPDGVEESSSTVSALDQDLLLILNELAEQYLVLAKLNDRLPSTLYFLEEYKRIQSGIDITRINSEADKQLLGLAYALYGLSSLSADEDRIDEVRMSALAALRLNPREWRTAYLGALALEKLGAVNEARDLALAAMISLEEEESRHWQVGLATDAMRARVQRNRINAQIESLSGLDAQAITDATRRLEHTREEAVMRAVHTLESSN